MKEIWIQFREWILHLFNPHCEECEQAKVCKNCEYLRLMIEQERAEKSRLLALAFHEEHQDKEVNPYVNVKKHIPWHVKRQMLESESREAARRQKDGIHLQDTESSSSS